MGRCITWALTSSGLAAPKDASRRRTNGTRRKRPPPLVPVPAAAAVEDRRFMAEKEGRSIKAARRELLEVKILLTM